MDKLQQARTIINDVDAKMAELFEKRMYASELVAKFKKENGLSILDTARENEVVHKNSQMIKNSVYREYYSDFIKNYESVLLQQNQYFIIF
jgi:chorismate mutase/prephenate dehydratase